jgi:serine/threonine-protein phosphatase 4 regulatory subunit 1
MSNALTFIERLLPAFMRLSQDDIWGVRKACAESIVDMSKALESSIRASALTPVLLAFAGDASKWVRIAAYQQVS